jgi:hypothetical protein
MTRAAAVALTAPIIIPISLRRWLVAGRTMNHGYGVYHKHQLISQTHHKAKKLRSEGFEVVCPFEDGYVLGQVLFMDTPKRAEEIPQPCPNSFHHTVVHFAHAIAVVVASIFSPRMAHRVMSTPRFTQMIIG